MEYYLKVASAISVVIAAFLIYYLLDKFYFSKKEKALINSKRSNLNIVSENTPKILNELPSEENIFDDEWTADSKESFYIEDHEISDPYQPKTLEDLDATFKKNSKNINLDDDLQNFIN